MFHCAKSHQIASAAKLAAITRMVCPQPSSASNGRLQNIFHTSSPAVFSVTLYSISSSTLNHSDPVSVDLKPLFHLP